MKNLFASLDAKGQLGVLAAADPALPHEVASASRMSWLPVELNVRTVEALAGTLGEEQGLGLLSDCVYAQLDTPLWKSFIGGAIRLLGPDPGSLGRWIPEAIGIAFRGCGRWTVESSAETELTVRVARLPGRLAAHRLWLRSFAAGISTPLFVLCGVAGNARLAEVDERTGNAAYVIGWKAQAGR
jgi:hypothetical protein